MEGVKYNIMYAYQHIMCYAYKHIKFCTSIMHIILKKYHDEHPSIPWDGVEQPLPTVYTPLVVIILF